MAKENGLGFSVSVTDSASAAKTISNDVTTLEYATPRDVLEVTGVDVSAMERILGLADFTVKLSGVFNDEADKSHAVFKTVPSTSVDRTIVLGISGQSLTCVCVVPEYSIKRSDKGELTWDVNAMLSDGSVPTWS